MSKPSFTAVVLCERAPLRDALRDALSEHGEAANCDADSRGWAYGAAGLTVAFEGFRLRIDAVDSRWPDELGADGKDAVIHEAAREGCFGALTFPGALERARMQAWTFPAARKVVPRSTSFVRLRIERTEVALTRAASDAAYRDAQARRELLVTTAFGHALFSLPETLAWFAPGGETLLDGDALRSLLERHAHGGPPPVEAWMNVRLFDLEDGQTTVQDTVGGPQLQIDDVELLYPQGGLPPGEGHHFLLDLAMYRLERGASVLQPGHAVRGPEGLPWRVEAHEDSFGLPQRPVLRLFAPGFLGPEIDVATE